MKVITYDVKLINEKQMSFQLTDCVEKLSKSTNLEVRRTAVHLIKNTIEKMQDEIIQVGFNLKTD